MLKGSIEAAACALARGAPLEALSLVGHQTEPIALALRGMALAQMREYESARRLLKEAIQSFDRENAPLSRARAVAALAEISVAERELVAAEAELDEAAQTLHKLGDRTNAAWTRLLQARLAAFNRGLDHANDVIALAQSETLEAPPTIRAAMHLARAELLSRSFAPAAALAEIESGVALIDKADNPLLWGELQAAQSALLRPVVYVRSDECSESLSSVELERRLLDAPELFVDGVRREARCGSTVIELGRRPVLFEILLEMALSWPAPAPAARLLERVFEVREPTEADREKLRVELSRLRKIVSSVAAVEALDGGWRLKSNAAVGVVSIVPLHQSEHAALLALLSDGELWTAKSLSSVLGTSTRTIARHLAEMIESGVAVAVGDGRTRRYSTPLRSSHLAGQMLSLGILGR